MCHDWLQFCSQKRICPLETPYYYDSVLISFSYTYTFWRWLLLLVLNDKPKTTSLTKRNDIQPIYFIRVLCTRVKYVDINWSYIIRPIHSFVLVPVLELFFSELAEIYLFLQVPLLWHRNPRPPQSRFSPTAKPVENNRRWA